jgi:hypothetical protein
MRFGSVGRFLLGWSMLGRARFLWKYRQLVVVSILAQPGEVSS